MGAHFLTTRCNADKQQDGAGAIPGLTVTLTTTPTIVTIMQQIE